MERMWHRIEKILGGHTIVVRAVVVAVTGLLAGCPRPAQFCTGQDSYLDRNSTAAKDNARYQQLFGGESMEVLVTMLSGKTVFDVFTPANQKRFDALASTLHQSGNGLESIVTPLTAFTCTQDLVNKGVATQILSNAIVREPDKAASALRQKDAALTLARMAAAGEQSLSNPNWLRFLLLANMPSVPRS